MSLVLLRSGDIHPNPGPTLPETSYNTNANNSLSTSDASATHHLSFIHYNIQSLMQKIDVLYTGLRDFDIISLTETWLNSSISSTDILFEGFHQPIRKDRLDSYGGVAIYVNENIAFKRRHDLELNNVESLWIEVFPSKHKSVLFGLFYRPPSADRSYMHSIENSIGLARDTQINDIIITGDFNINTIAELSARTINELCLQYDLTQLINEPTHYTEHSSSIIDLIFVSNPNTVLLSGTGEPILDQTIRYHCPVFVTLKFIKPLRKTFYRHIWRYDIGDYSKLRQLMTDTNWGHLKCENVDIYAENITKTILQIAGSCIPNKNVCIRSRDLPWLNNIIKKKIRQRKRLYRKAKQLNSDMHWLNFRRVRNEVVLLLRNSKNEYFNNIAR